LIRNEILAEIRNLGGTRSQVIAGGDIIVNASDKSRIIGITGSLAISGTGTGVGVALATNDILNTTTARIRNSTTTTTGGQITVGAGFDVPLSAKSPTSLYAGGKSVNLELPSANGKDLSNPQIVSISIGVASSASGTAVGGSAPVNVNKSVITASIDQSSTVYVDNLQSVWLAADKVAKTKGLNDYGVLVAKSLEGKYLVLVSPDSPEAAFTIWKCN
jgi:hypothetical protein